MSIKVAGIDLASEIIDLRYQLIRTQLIMDALISNSPNLYSLKAEDVEQIEKKALADLQRIYPEAGITKK